MPEWKIQVLRFGNSKFVSPESRMDKHFCIDELSEDEIMMLCQCLGYFCSFPHTGFEQYYDPPNAPISDDEHSDFLKTTGFHNQVSISESSTPLENDIKPLLSSIADSLREIGQKQIFDPINLKRV
jgi:hypothetical protein